MIDDFATCKEPVDEEKPCPFAEEIAPEEPVRLCRCCDQCREDCSDDI